MKEDTRRLHGQTALITGSSSGIGAAIAIAMAKDGANVTINYHSDKAGAEAVAHTIYKYDKDCKTIIIKADVSKEQDVKNLFDKTIKEFGTIDICVANAGLQKDYPLHEMPLEAWNKVLEVNLTGHFLCAKQALREFIGRGMREDVSKSLGKIIHMSSVHEVIPWAGHANYAASKGAIVMLMQSIAQGYASQKVRCNSIAPGAIKTDINKNVWETKKGMEQILKLIPYNRMGEPEDIGKVASWLASDESEYINGTTIFVDGGMTCYPGFTENG